MMRMKKVVGLEQPVLAFKLSRRDGLKARVTPQPHPASTHHCVPVHHVGLAAPALHHEVVVLHVLLLALPLPPHDDEISGCCHLLLGQRPRQNWTSEERRQTRESTPGELTRPTGAHYRPLLPDLQPVSCQFSKFGQVWVDSESLQITRG